MPEPRALTPSQVSKTTKAVLAQRLNEEIYASAHVNERLLETLQNMDMMLDNRGWAALSTYATNDDGPDLDQIKEAARQIQNLVALNGLVKRGRGLRTGNVWSGGIHYGNIEGKRQGKGVNVQERIDLPQNQEAFFGQSAREERESCYYSDSMAMWLGDDTTFELEQLPILKVTNDYRNPDNSAEIWAFRKEWTRMNPETGKGETVAEWYYINRHWSKRRDFIKFGNKNEPVSQTKRVFGSRPVNSITGWAYGVPDALPMIPHVRQYLEAVASGKTMSDSMAKLAYVAKVNSQSGAEKVGVKINTTGAGGTAAIGQTNELQALSTAGRGYDFASLVPLLALAATSIGVSTISLSSNTANAGSSYGAAQTLSKPEKDETRSRRQFSMDVDREVLVWMGAKDPQIWFDSLEDEAERYRRDQATGIRWGTGLYEPEEIKHRFEDSDGKADIKPVPDGVMLPNNTRFPQTTSNDGDSSAAANGGDFTPTQGSGQEFGNGGSGDQNGNDIRND